MNRKLLALLLCMALLVSGLAAATAEDMETVTTISLKAGPLMAELGDDVAKVMDMATVRFHSMTDQLGAFVLTLNDTDVFKSLFKMEEDGVYVQSRVFGAQPLYFTWDDIQTFIEQQMEASMDMETMDPEAFKMMQGMMDGTLTDEDISSMMGYDEELIEFANEIEARAATEEGTFFVEGSDAATLKTVTVFTAEDAVRIIQMPMVRENVASQLAMADPELTQAEVDTMVYEQLAQMEKEILASNLNAEMIAYTSDDELIAFTFDLTADADEYEGETIPMGIYAQVTRTTIDTAKFYQFAVTFTQGDESFLNQSGSLYMADNYSTGQYTLFSMPNEPLLQIAMNCDREEANHTNADMSFTVYDSFSGEVQSIYLMLDQNRAESVTDTAIDVFVGGTVEEIKAAQQDMRLVSMKINTVTQPDSGFFAALDNATPESSVQLLTMNDEEMESYMLTLQNGLMMTVLSVIDNLPPEMSESLMLDMGAGGF